MKHPPAIIEASEALHTQGLLLSGNMDSYASIVDALTIKLNALLNSDFAALVELLYRLDVSEHKLKTALNSSTEMPAARQMAVLVLDRQLEKINTRRMFSQQHDIPDEERW